MGFGAHNPPRQEAAVTSSPPRCDHHRRSSLPRSGFVQSDFDIEDREIITSLKVNPPDELRVRLHWTAILHGQVGADLAVAGGVRDERDIVKCIMAGARVAFTASALLQNGAEHANHMLAALDEWLDMHGYVSVEEMCGSMSYCAVPDPTTFMRGDSASALRSFDL